MASRRRGAGGVEKVKSKEGAQREAGGCGERGRGDSLEASELGMASPPLDVFTIPPTAQVSRGIC